MNRPRQEPKLDPQTARAYSYAKRHDDSGIYRITDEGHAVMAPPITLESALELVELARTNTYSEYHSPPKGRIKRGRNN